jgi:hypothetical protein
MILFAPPYRFQLTDKLVGRPEIVVVDERHLLAAGLRQAVVAGGTYALRSMMPDETNPRVAHVGEHGWSVVDGRLVDHDHLDIDVALLQHTGQSNCQPPASVAREHDDRNVQGHHRRRA